MMLLSSALVCIFFSFISQIETTEKCNCTKIKMFLGEDKPMDTNNIAGTQYYALVASEFENSDEISSIKGSASKVMNNTSNVTRAMYDYNGKKVSRMNFLVTSCLGGEKLPFILDNMFAARYRIPCYGELIAEFICQKSGKGGPFPTYSISTSICNKNVNEDDLEKCKILIQKRIGQDITFTPQFKYPPEPKCGC